MTINQLHLTDCIDLTHVNGSQRKPGQFGTVSLEAAFNADSAVEANTASRDLPPSAYALPLGCC